jgi:Ca2+-binding RTX toxin-like protein
VNKSPTITSAGSWDFATTIPSFAVVPFYSQIKLGLNQNKGIVLGGWAYSGWENTTFNPINIAILDQQSDGTLKVNTSKYVSDPLTNGEGSVIVSDFNGDGIDDIFLAAHNESPSIDKSSTVYLSNGTDSFTKLSLDDAVQAHSARLSDFNGVKTVVTAGYGSSDPFYQFDNASGTFKVLNWGNSFTGHVFGSSALTGDFNNDGTSELVIVDFNIALADWNRGYEYDASRPQTEVIYDLNGAALSNTRKIIANPYFNDKAAYDIYVSDGAGKTHQANVWAEDFNHDNKLDLIVGSEIFAKSGGIAPAVLQFLQNQGSLEFEDVTDQLQSTLPKGSWFNDYAMQILDIDHSGINSFLVGMYTYGTTGFPGNYILLNDGTGQTYSAIDQSQFATWGQQLKSFASSTSFVASPQLISYQTSNGAINFLACMGSFNGKMTLLNLPIQYNPITDFTQVINVQSRNGSSLIRTFAGNDSINDSNRSQSATHIDGGLGIDTSIYSGLSSDYTITKTSTGYTVQDNLGLFGADTLINIEKLQFNDKTISLIPPIEGTAIKDKLAGTADDDEIYGLAGNDSLTGLAGNDTLDGGTGNDTMIGGVGDDTYYVDAAKDVATEKSNQGTDSIISSISYTLGLNVENLTLTGTSGLSGKGNAATNVIIGSSGNDTVNGGLGNDTLTGGTGNDTFVFNTKLGATNIDTITDFTSGADKIALDDAIFTKLRGDKNLSDNLYIQSIPGISTQDTNDYLFYDFESGRLYYDADGSRAHSDPVVIVIIGSATEIAATDFMII